MRIGLLLFHGWGFDSTFWQPLQAELSSFPVFVSDRGYFGPAKEPVPEGPVLVIGHSLGALIALSAPPSGCRGMVAINGFDHFAERTDAAGVPRRILDRMVAKFASAPGEVVADFRSRCGAPPGPPPANAAALEADLHRLRDADERRRSRQWAVPLLSLQGEQDPILPQPLREHAFSGARRCERHTHPSAGHLLPLSHPAWCAERIIETVERLG